jgi:hypothetical protein
MSTLLKVFFISFCCAVVWVLSSWPEMIIVTDYHNGFNDSSVIAGIATPLIIIAAVTLLIVMFSILGAALMTIFVVMIPLALIGVFFSWPVLFVGVVLYWLFKQPNHQKA